MGRLLLTIAVLVVLVGAIGRGTLRLMHGPNAQASQHANPRNVDECVAEAASNLGSALTRVAPANAHHLTAAKLQKALRPFCEKWTQSPESGSLTQETGPPFVSRLLRENPSVYNTLCYAGLDAETAARPEVFRYLTKRERRRLRRDTCRLQRRYMRTDAPVVDYQALIVAHPDVYVLACRATLQSVLAQSQVARKRFTGSERRVIALRSCREALRAGIVDASGARALLDARVDQRQLDQIILRFARQEARS